MLSTRSSRPASERSISIPAARFGASETPAPASVVKRYPGLAAGLEADRLRMARRALRFRVDELAANTEDGILWLEFRLGRGSYATSVIREIVEAVA